MDRRSRVLATLLVGLLVVSTVSAVAGTTAAGPDTAASSLDADERRVAGAAVPSGSSVSAPARADTDASADPTAAFAPDTLAKRTLDRRDTVTDVTVTENGGRARAVGTDDVLTDADRNLTVTQRLALTPETRGEITVTHVFEVPDGVSTIETGVPDGVTVTGTDGFSAAGSGTYRWDGQRDRATLTYTTRVNETIDLGGPEGFEGEYLFADAGEWALVRRPQVSLSWSWQGTEPVGFRRSGTTSGPGYVGDTIVYMGRHETHTRTAHGQTMTLVVPRRASLSESPDRVLDTLTDASDRFRVGDRDDRVHVVAAPTTTGVTWGVRGLQLGEAAMWVRDEERLDSADNTWLHEYVHSRQDFQTRASGRWLTEASATYYGALLALETDRTGFEEFRSFLERGTRRPQAGAVLAEPSTWDNAANYWKGGLVVGALDRRIRLATDRRRSFGTVFSRLNERSDPVDGTAFLDTVETTAGSGVGDTASTYATTSAVPETWTTPAHTEAFGETPARFTYRFGPPAESDTFSVSGPYRNESVDGSPLTLYTGETLRARATVSNVGGAGDEYEQVFATESRVYGTVSGRLDPGETATHTFERAFESSGERTLFFGTDAVDLRVEDPATAAITNVTVQPLRLDRPGTTTVDVTVTNEFGIPAARTVSVTRDGESVGSRDVALPPGERRTVSFPVELSAPGEYEIGVADAGSATAVVEDSSDGPSALGPGFGPAVAVLALVLAGLAGRVRRR